VIDTAPSPSAVSRSHVVGTRAWNTLDGIAPWIAAVATITTFVGGVRWGTNAVGGSDSHCYVGQALMFASGHLSIPPPLALPVPWPHAVATFVPSGFTPAPDGSLNQVPLCPAGLSLLMAGAIKAGGNGAWFWVVPLLGAVGVWSTYLLGRQMADRRVGAAASILLACSPIFLFQLFQPMSDVPAAALWTSSLVAALGGSRRRNTLSPEAKASNSPINDALVSGLLASAAILVRPNLAPLALVPVLMAWPSWRAAVATIAGIVPGVAAVAVLQAAVYGSPFHSGYGALAQIFSLSHVVANMQRYPAWLAEAHTPVLLVALATPFLLRPARWAWLLAAFVVATLVAYLPYVPFDDWWYSRFLLPALPALIVLTAIAMRWVTGRLPGRSGTAGFVLLVAVLGGWWLHRAVDLSAFRLQSLERKYVAIGQYATRLPAHAVVLGAQATGAVRYYANLPTLAWDAIDPAWLDRVVSELRSRGYEPYLAIESFEADTYKSRFRERSAFGQLDWPPRAVIGRVISVYATGDRARYLAGEHYQTERITWAAKQGDGSDRF
jgi:hypothetical protein